MECSCGAYVPTTSQVMSTEEALRSFPGQKVNIPKNQSEIMIRYGACTCGRLSFWANPTKVKAQAGIMRFFK